jgi:hypothetical protein
MDLYEELSAFFLSVSEAMETGCDGVANDGGAVDGQEGLAGKRLKTGWAMRCGKMLKPRPQ